MRPSLIVWSLVVLQMAAVDSAALAQQRSVVTLQGTIVSSVDSHPLQGVSVKIVPAGRYQTSPSPGLTDAEGVFKVDVPDDTGWQVVSITARVSGYRYTILEAMMPRGRKQPLGPYHLVPQDRTVAADLDRILDDLAEIGKYEGTSSDVQEEVAALRQIFPDNFAIGSPLLARALEIQFPNGVQENVVIQEMVNVNASEVLGLPVNGRQMSQLLLQVPGVTSASGSWGDVRFNGRAQSFLIDGISVDGTGPLVTSLIPTLPWDSFASIRVGDSMSAELAEYGRGLDVVTKSGSNGMHGSAFEYFGNEGLNANTAINESLSRPKSAYRSNFFGGTAGGPIRRDHDFFFVSSEVQRFTQQQTVFTNVPIELPDDPLTLLALQRLEPLAADWDLVRNPHRLFVKADHRLSNSHSLYATFAHESSNGQRIDNNSYGTQQSIEGTDIRERSSNGVTASMSSIITPTAFNELRAQYFRNRDRRTPYSDAPHAEVRENGTLVLSIGGNQFAPSEQSSGLVQFSDTVNWVVSTHSLKTGFSFADDSSKRTYDANFAGSYIFDTLASFALGRPSGESESFTQAFTGPGTAGSTSHPDTRDYGAFVQDEWKLTSRATLNLGLRFQGQHFPVPGVSNSDAQLVAANIDTRGIADDLRGWAPRVSAVFAPTDWLVTRAGYGLFVGRTSSAMVAAAQINNGLDVQTLTLPGDGPDAGPIYPERLAAAPATLSARPTILAFNSDFGNERTHQVSGGADLNLPASQRLNVTYTYARGTDLSRALDLNVGESRPVIYTVSGSGESLQGYRIDAGPFTHFGRVISLQSTAESTYHDLTLFWSGSRAAAVRYQVSYSLAKLTDTVPTASALVPESLDDRRFASNPLAPAADLAHGDADMRHRGYALVSLSSDRLADNVPYVLGTILKQWTLDTIVRVDSGRPYSAYVTTDINGDRNRYNDLAPGTRRNAFRLPATSTLDLRLTRRIGSSTRGLSLGVNVMNVLNRANYTAVNNVLYSVDGLALTSNPLFGQFIDQGDPRIVQLVARFVF